MSYLTDDEIMEIRDNVSLLSIKDIDDISHYSFNSNIAEYNDFLEIAEKFYDLNISKTFLLEMARAYAFEMNELGIACRFITVDADIEYNQEIYLLMNKSGQYVSRPRYGGNCV